MLKIRVYSDEREYDAACISQAAKSLIKRLNQYPVGFSDNFDTDSIIVILNNYNQEAIDELSKLGYILLNNGMLEFHRLKPAKESNLIKSYDYLCDYCNFLLSVICDCKKIPEANEIIEKKFKERKNNR